MEINSEYISNQKEQTINEIVGALKEAMRLKESEPELEDKWRDFANEEGISINGEALDMYLLSLWNFEENLKGDVKQASNYSDEILNIFPREKITEDAKKYVGKIKDAGRFLGTPYINYEEGESYSFMDSACFFLTFYYTYLSLFENFDSDLREDLDDVAIRAFRFLDDSYISNDISAGWNFTDVDKPSRPYLYPTWMALETLEDYVSDKEFSNKILPDEASTILKTVENQYFPEILEYLEARYLDTQEKYIPEIDENKGTFRDHFNILKGAVNFPAEPPYYHYNLYIIVSLELLGSERTGELSTAINTVFNGFQVDKKTRIKYLEKSWDVNFTSDSEEIFCYFEDRAFLPLLGKAISIFISQHPNNDQHWEQVLDIYERMIDNRKEDMKVWDYYAVGGSGYAIYYTERAIEGLFRVFQAFSAIEDELSGEESEVARSKDLQELFSYFKEYVPKTYNINLEVNEADVEEMVKDITEEEIKGQKEKIQSIEEELDKLKEKVNQEPEDIDLETVREKIDSLLEEDIEKATREMKKYIKNYAVTGKLNLNNLILEWEKELADNSLEENKISTEAVELINMSINELNDPDLAEDLVKIADQNIKDVEHTEESKKDLQKVIDSLGGVMIDHD